MNFNYEGTDFIVLLFSIQLVHNYWFQGRNDTVLILETKKTKLQKKKKKRKRRQKKGTQ